jgi:hypothetical protein
LDAGSPHSVMSSWSASASNVPVTEPSFLP